MDSVDIVSSPTPLKKINKFSSLVVFLFSLALSFLTINFLFYGKSFDLGMEILSGLFLAPVLFICLSIFYFALLKKVYNPKMLIPLLFFVIVFFSCVYYFRIKSPEPYPAYLTTDKQIYYSGDEVELSIIPKDLSTVYYNSNSIDVPISMLLPDGSTIQGAAKITPTTYHCESNIFFNKCTVAEQHFGFGISTGMRSIFSLDVYKLTQTGKYIISSSNPSIQGTSFEVKPAIQQQIVNDSELFPKIIGAYEASDSQKVHTTNNTTELYSLYFSPESPNTYVNVDITSFNSAELANASERASAQKGERVDRFGQQVVQTFKESADVNQNIFNTPVVTWVSGNKIISIWATSHTNSPIDDFLKIFLGKYPSTF